MKPKIAIIIDSTFTKRDYQRFGINTLRKKFNIFIFDFTKKFSKKFANYNFAHKTYKCKGYHSIKRLSSFVEFLEKYEFSNCISYINNKTLKLKLFNIFKKNRVPLIKIQNGLVIGPAAPRSFIQNLHILSLKFTDKKKFMAFISNQINKIINKFTKKETQIIYDKVVVTGRVGLKDAAIGLQTKIIYAHSFDYDNYLNYNKQSKLRIKKPFAVFLDQYVPHHPDAPIFYGESPKCTPEKYYPALNNFFNIFEKKHNMKVIVCAHPKSNYENNINYLYGRKFIKNETINLVEKCNIVFAHNSTSITYAVLYKKPLVFLLSNEYIRSYDNYTPSVIAKKLNSPCFNIDYKNNKSKIQHINLFKIDKKKYKIYIDDYIKYPSRSHDKFWEIFNEKI